MLSGKQKLKIAAAFVTHLLLAAGLGCSGFFVDPTLTGVTASPTSVTLSSVGATQQLTLTGNYNDGSTKNLTSATGTSWTSSDNSTVTVSSSGIVKAVTINNTTVSVTGSNGGFTSAAVSVCPGSSCGGTTGLTINSSLGTSISLSTDPAGTAISFTATLNGSDVTSSTSFSVTSGPTGVIDLSGTSGQGTIGGAQGTVTIQGTDGSNTGTISVTVGP